VLKGIFGLKKDEVTGGWRKLHNEELCNLYSSPSIITTKTKMWWVITRKTKMWWVDNIKMDLGEI
jgi:hypothetical protein